MNENTKTKFSYHYSSLRTYKNYPLCEMKRENMDKKLIRKFFRYFRNNSHLMKDLPVLQRFVNNNQIPPYRNDRFLFKSVNTSYLMWLMSFHEVRTGYQIFIKESIDYMVNWLTESFPDFIRDKEVVKSYFLNFSSVYHK